MLASRKIDCKTNKRVKKTRTSRSWKGQSQKRRWQRATPPQVSEGRLRRGSRHRWTALPRHVTVGG